MPKVFIQREKKDIKIDAETVRQILDKLNLNPGTVIVAKNNEIVTEDETVTENDNIQIIPVISGG